MYRSHLEITNADRSELKYPREQHEGALKKKEKETHKDLTELPAN